MAKIKMDIVGISETRMNGVGRIDYRSGYTMYYCGRTSFEDGERRATNQGVGFYLQTELTKKVVDVCYHSPQMMDITLKLNERCKLRLIQVHAPHSGRGEEEYDDFLEELQMMDITLKLNERCKLRLIQVHAPHSGRGEEEYDDFLEELQIFLNSKNCKNYVVMGDFNGSIGAKRAKEQFRGPHSASTHRNTNGISLCDFCEINKLHISNSCFQKPSRKRWTYVSPKKEEFEIDFMLVPRVPMMTDVTILNLFNAGSDHRM
uniref:Endo/exonuclease/phosphatase domain-containing protein n=1 Tax=Panagrellus redivivus TaxID=6233 RepID=A0A7E4WE43_PANRE